MASCGQQQKPDPARIPESTKRIRKIIQQQKGSSPEKIIIWQPLYTRRNHHRIRPDQITRKRNESQAGSQNIGLLASCEKQKKQTAQCCQPGTTLCTNHCQYTASAIQLAANNHNQPGKLRRIVAISLRKPVISSIPDIGRHELLYSLQIFWQHHAPLFALE
jgi:hypothetical protein